MKAIANVLHQWHAQDKRWLELPCEPNKRTHVYQWTLKHTLTAMCQFKNETNSIDLIDIHLELSYNVVHATFLYLIYTIGNKTTVWFWSCHIQYSQELILFSLPLCHSLNISHTHTHTLATLDCTRSSTSFFLVPLPKPTLFLPVLSLCVETRHQTAINVQNTYCK